MAKKVNRRRKPKINLEASVQRSVLDLAYGRATNEDTKRQIKMQRELLRNRKKVTADEAKTVSNLIQKSNLEAEEKNKILWERKKSFGDIQFLLKQAEKNQTVTSSGEIVSITPERAKEIKDLIKSGKLTMIHGSSDEARYSSEFGAAYTKEDKEQVMLNFLGIGSRGITLSDGTVFTEDEFKEILTRLNIPMEKFFDEYEMYKIKYDEQIYNTFKESIEDDMIKLINSKELTEREKEGVGKMIKLYGTD